MKTSSICLLAALLCEMVLATPEFRTGFVRIKGVTSPELIAAQLELKQETVTARWRDHRGTERQDVLRSSVLRNVWEFAGRRAVIAYLSDTEMARGVSLGPVLDLTNSVPRLGTAVRFLGVPDPERVVFADQMVPFSVLLPENDPEWVNVYVREKPRGGDYHYGKVFYKGGRFTSEGLWLRGVYWKVEGPQVFEVDLEGVFTADRWVKSQMALQLKVNKVETQGHASLVLIDRSAQDRVIVGIDIPGEEAINLFYVDTFEHCGAMLLESGS